MIATIVMGDDVTPRAETPHEQVGLTATPDTGLPGHRWLDAYSPDALKALLPLCEGLPMGAAIKARLAQINEAAAARERAYQAQAAALGAEYAALIREGGRDADRALFWFWARLELHTETEGLVMGAALRALAAENHVAAMPLIGRAHLNGVCGFPRDHRVAVDWFRRAARAGHCEGAAWLGRAYEKGIGVAPDIDQAIYWYLQSADQLWLEGMIWLAEILHARPFSMLAKQRLATLHGVLIKVYESRIESGFVATPATTRMDVHAQLMSYGQRDQGWER